MPMGHKRAATFAVGGVLIMLSFYTVMESFRAIGGGGQLMPLALILAAIGFYLVGYSFDIE